MKDYFKPLLSITQTSKFWMALFTAVITYLTIKFGATPEMSLFMGVLGSLGVYHVNNTNVSSVS